MNTIQFNIDKSINSKGRVYDSTDRPHILSEAMCELDLPGGLHVSIGWEPECDPSGSFHIVLFGDYWAEPIKEKWTRDISEMKRLVESISAEYLNIRPPSAAKPVQPENSEICDELPDSSDASVITFTYGPKPTISCWSNSSRMNIYVREERVNA